MLWLIVAYVIVIAVLAYRENCDAVPPAGVWGLLLANTSFWVCGGFGWWVGSFTLPYAIAVTLGGSSAVTLTYALVHQYRRWANLV